MYTQKLLAADKITWLNELGVDTYWLKPIAQQPDTKPAGAKPVPAKAAASQHVSQTTASATPAISTTAKMPGPAAASTTAATAPTVATALAQLTASAILACDSLEQLNQLYQQALAGTDTSLVFGAGPSKQPKYMIIGEQPGSDDEAAALPFQGAQGQLLQAIFAAVSLPQAQSCYKTHVLKYRLPGGKQPDADQVASNLSVLKQEIQIIQPENIIALGSIAAGALLGNQENLKAMHGQMNYYQLNAQHKIPLWISHQPVALLVHGARKAQVWRDFIAIASFNASSV